MNTQQGQKDQNNEEFLKEWRDAEYRAAKFAADAAKARAWRVLRRRRQTPTQIEA